MHRAAPDSWSMARRILSVLAGLAVAVVFFMLFQGTSGAMYPPPPGLDLNKPEDLATYIDTLPQTAMFIVLLGYAVGSLMGGFVTAKVMMTRAVTPGQLRTPVLILGGLLTLASILNLRSIPHPTWFTVINLAVFFPMVLAGARLTQLRFNKP